MKSVTRKGLTFALLCSLSLTMTWGIAGETLSTMKDELDRSFEFLQNQEEPPYYLSYEITENATANVRGGFGEISGEDTGVTRVLDIDMRLGDYSLDNTRQVQTGFGGLLGNIFALVPKFIPVEEDDALRTTLWSFTDAAYKQAVTQFATVKNSIQTTVEATDQSGDFSTAPVSQFSMERVELVADTDLWRTKLQLYTKPFAEAEFIRDNSGSITGDVETRWFVNSDGTKIMVSKPYYRMIIQATTKADDGMLLSLTRTFEADTAAQLLDDESVLVEVNKMIDKLEKVRVAPLVEPYTGPAILSGRATGVFFHEILGHRLEGHRQKLDDEGQTFKDKVGEKLLPDGFSVVFDPNVDMYEDVELVGDYKFDNEGVAGQRVVAIEDGVLKGFLMSRVPIDGYPESNGHGRKQPGNTVVARQSNLFIEVDNPHTPEELEAMLLERVREQGKEFGLYFEDISGGFTMTGRTMPNAFNVTPVMVYKIHLDGTRELVRGVDLIGTPLTVFSQVEAAASDFEVFNGNCGAESGWVPVSAVAPSILVGQIEVQKKSSNRDIPPILPTPVGPPEGQSIQYIGEER